MPFLLVMYYTSIFLQKPIPLIWRSFLKISKETFLWIPDCVQMIGQLGNSALGRWDSYRRIVLRKLSWLPYETHELSSPETGFSCWLGKSSYVLEWVLQRNHSVPSSWLSNLRNCTMDTSLHFLLVNGYNLTSCKPTSLTPQLAQICVRTYFSKLS